MCFYMNTNINNFDWKFYTTYYKDLSHIKTEIKAKEHYLKFGVKENRLKCKIEDPKIWIILCSLLIIDNCETI